MASHSSLPIGSDPDRGSAHGIGSQSAEPGRAFSISSSSVPAISLRQAMEPQQPGMLPDRLAFERRLELRRIGVVRIDAPADFARNAGRPASQRETRPPGRFRLVDRPSTSHAKNAAGTMPASVNRNMASR